MYGGLRFDQARRLTRLETENSRPKRAVANLTLDDRILREETEDECLQLLDYVQACWLDGSIGRRRHSHRRVRRAFRAVAYGYSSIGDPGAHA